MKEKNPKIIANAEKLPLRLLEDIQKMIREARMGVARTVNTIQTSLYWNVGQRIRQDILH